MAEYDSSQVAFFTVDGYSLLGFSSRITDPGARLQTVDRTALGETVSRKKMLALIDPVTIAQEGFFDDAAAASHEALKNKRGTDQVLCYGVQGNAIGSHFVGAVAPQAKYDPLISKGDMHRTRAEWECTQRESGLIVAHLAARTTAGNTQATPVDNGAASSTGAVAYLAATALTLGGYTNLAVKVRDSADNVTYADIGSFTVRTTVGAERIVIAGTVRRYLAISWAWTGAGAGQSFTGLVGVART